MSHVEHRLSHTMTHKPQAVHLAVVVFLVQRVGAGNAGVAGVVGRVGMSCAPRVVVEVVGVAGALGGVWVLWGCCGWSSRTPLPPASLPPPPFPLPSPPPLTSVRGVDWCLVSLPPSHPPFRNRWGLARRSSALISSFGPHRVLRPSSRPSALIWSWTARSPLATFHSARILSPSSGGSG